jgi:hypothetical protein
MTDVFDMYDDFKTIDTAKWDLNWIDPTKGNESVFAGGQAVSGNTHSSYRAAFACHKLPIEIKDDQLQIAGEGTYNIAAKSALSTDLLYEIKFKAPNEANTQVIIGDKTSLASNTAKVCPYYFSKLSNTNSVWVKTDLQKGNNFIYVYYNSGTATDASNGTDTFLFFDNFADTTLSNWIQTWTPATSNGTRIDVPSKACVYSNNKFHGSIGMASEQCRNSATRGNIMSLHTTAQNYIGAK